LSEARFIDPVKCLKVNDHKAIQDRTGQDRTGLDRKGQERTGKDRKGQERTGKDRKGTQSMARNFAEFNKIAWKFNEEWTTIRLIGDLRSFYVFWIPIVTHTGRHVSIPKIALDWDSERHCRIDRVCPYSEAGLPGGPVYYNNAIIRSLQRAKTGIPANPVRIIRIPRRFYRNLCSFQATNRKFMKSGAHKYYDVAQPVFGWDIQVKINPDNPYWYYEVEPVERSKLTAEELGYRLLSLEVSPETLSEARVAWQTLKVLYAGKGQPVKTELAAWLATHQVGCCQGAFQIKAFDGRGAPCLLTI
jgi:hypothetical protein